MQYLGSIAEANEYYSKVGKESDLREPYRIPGALLAATELFGEAGCVICIQKLLIESRRQHLVIAGCCAAFVAVALTLAAYPVNLLLCQSTSDARRPRS